MTVCKWLCFMDLCLLYAYMCITVLIEQPVLHFFENKGLILNGEKDQHVLYEGEEYTEKGD